MTGFIGMPAATFAAGVAGCSTTTLEKTASWFTMIVPAGPTRPGNGCGERLRK
jgi:hypothetical protein